MVLPADGPAAATTVSGPAEAVLLLLWHRVGLDDPRLTVSGSRPPPTPCSRQPSPRSGLRNCRWPRLDSAAWRGGSGTATSRRSATAPGSTRSIGEYVALRRAGAGSLKGLCPFHDEKTPSFNVRPAHGTFHCFGCGEGGDAIAFVMKIEAIGFVEAVERLADRVGFRLTYEGGGSSVQRDRGTRTPAAGGQPGGRRVLRRAAAHPGGGAGRRSSSPPAASTSPPRARSAAATPRPAGTR